MKLAFLLVVPSALLLAPPLSAQLAKLSETPVGGSPESVEVGGGFAFVSLHSDGVQMIYDISNPFAPSLCPTSPFNPSWGDQFGDGHYWDGNGSVGPHLFTGHRFGGLNMIDVSDPCNTVTESDSVSTTYLHEGLTTWGDFLFYGEHPAGGTAGGIRIYDLSAGSLNEVGNVLNPLGTELDGGDVAVSSDGNWCFQISPTGFKGVSTTALLVVYDVSDKSNPMYQTDVALMGPFMSFDAELVISSDDTHVFIAPRVVGEGLQIVDVSNPLAPVVSQVFASPGLTIEEVDFYHPTILLVSGNLSGGQSLLAAMGVSNPASPVLLPTITGTGGSVTDLTSHGGLIYTTTRNTANGDVLQVWF